MPISTANFCREASGTGGTGTYNLGGATGRYQTFVDAVGDGAKVYYHAFDDQDFESGIGTITDGSPDTLSRDTILESSNADAAVDWPASGQRTIVMTAPAQKTVLEDENGDVATSRDVYAGRDLYVNGGINYDDTDTGSADAYAIQLASTLTAYRDGLLVMFKAANANTGASTLDINGIGAKNLKRRNGDALESGDIAANDRVIAYYDATDDEFRCVNIAGTASNLNSSNVIQNGGTTLPSILSDTKANRPAAGTAGRWFYAEDEERWYRDTGASWETKNGHLERVLVWENVSQSISSGVSDVLEFGNEDYDIGDMWDSGDPANIVCPRAGLVVLTASLSWGENSSGTRQILIGKNGTGFIQYPKSKIPAGSSGVQHSLSTPAIEVVANDNFQVFVFQDSGVSLSVFDRNFSLRYIE